MLLIAYGTRPEHLKIEPLLKYWKSIGFNDWKVWLTGQHEELCIDLAENWEFKNHCVQGEIANFKNRLDSIVSTLLINAQYFLFNIDYILVQGDTASAFACALAAFHRQIPIIHLEAGLRSNDNSSPYPEEVYRKCISQMAAIHLCPTHSNAWNISSETTNGQLFVVGNTILDPIKDRIGSFQNKILVTLHRREKLNDIVEWFNAIEKLAEKFQDHEFLLPIHKNPEIYKYKEKFKYVKCIDPLSHDELINYLADCKAVITDSGGIVEEATWFGKSIFLCRTKTERPEAEHFYIWTQTPEKLIFYFEKYFSFLAKNNNTFKCPFGDGNSSEKITNILCEQGIINRA